MKCHCDPVVAAGLLDAEDVCILTRNVAIKDPELVFPVQGRSMKIIERLQHSRQWVELLCLFLHRVVALPEVDLLPHHCAPDAEETPQVVKSATVKRVLVCTAVFEVGDAVARHELPGGGVERHQVEVRAQQQQHDERQ